MLLGRVIGFATATLKHHTLKGRRLLVVQPLAADGRSPDGQPLLGVDCVSAGRGDKVMLTSDGRSAREALGDEHTPVRWTIIGIRD